MTGGLLYVFVLAGLGFAIGSIWNVGTAVALAVVGGFIGRGMARARTARLAPERRASRRRAEVDTSALPAYKALYRDLEIVGESFRQRDLRKLWRDADTTHTAALVPESDNPHDGNAVRVEIDGRHVGYLSRDSASEYREYMGEVSCAVPVHLVRGGKEETIGVFTGKSSADKARGKRTRSIDEQRAR